MLAASGDLQLQLSDLIAIAGLVIAVVSALLAPLWISLRRAKKSISAALAVLDTAAAEHRAADAVSSVAWRSHALGLQAISNSLESCAGLLHRILLDRAAEVDADAAIRQLHGIKTGVDRAAAEAALLTGSKREQLAALPQLVHRLGDHATVALLNAAAQNGALGPLQADEIDEARRDLAERLVGTQPSDTS